MQAKTQSPAGVEQWIQSAPTATYKKTLKHIPKLNFLSNPELWRQLADFLETMISRIHNPNHGAVLADSFASSANKF